MSRFNELGDIRRSQVVTTFGPGSIIDFRSGKQRKAAISVVACGQDAWEDPDKVPPEIQDTTRIQEPRLQRVLKVSHFRLPPVTPAPAPWSTHERKVYLQGRRFPIWLQCPKCHRVKPAKEWKPELGDPALKCAPCSQASEDDAGVFVVPVRFVMACERGHLAEFPWDRWVQHKPTCGRAQRDLRLAARGGTGLASLFLKCHACHAEKNMDSVFSKGTFKGLSCTGRRPWLDDSETCDATPRALQRGASNLYFANHMSALDIPPWSGGLIRTLGIHWEALADAEGEDRATTFRVLNNSFDFTGRLQMSEEAILAAIDQKVKLLDEMSEDSLRVEEHLKFVSKEEKGTSDPEFEIQHQPVPQDLMSLLSHVIEVRRLREVRALVGFSRMSPVQIGDENMCKLTREPKNWLPAVEVRGEGIFIELNHLALRTWEHNQGPYLKKVVRDIQDQCDRQGKDLTDQPLSPRFLLVHSLAHALIRQLSLDCGYSSASLRERLYVQEGEEEMAGFLIYTGSTDADGTLGGLSRQAHPERFSRLMEGALKSMVWCSNDPLCVHGHGSSSEPTNNAACHACMLAAETSCETFNQLLDRTTIVGTPTNRKAGFFASLLKRRGAC